MSGKNILTGVVCALALILVVIVILVKTGVIDGVENTTEIETIIETSVVVESETNEEGSIEYITMVKHYPKPKYSSNHTYPTTKRKTTVPRSTTTTVPMLEMTSYIAVTDESGIPQFDENGVPFTEMLTYTVPADSTTTTEPTTEYVPKTSGVVVTNIFGRPEKDEDGNPVTELVTVEPPPTTLKDIWSENIMSGTTEENGRPSVEANIKRNDELAQAVVDQINRDREAEGLPALEHATGLKASARTNSMSLALPDVYGDPAVPGAYTLVTSYGGNAVYQTVKAANSEKVMSADTTQIGVGVVVYNGQYYTTVILN